MDCFHVWVWNIFEFRLWLKAATFQPRSMEQYAMTTRLMRVILGLSLLLVSSQTLGQAILPGFDSQTLPRNDDDSTDLVSLGFTVNFFGINRSTVYVNNNGNLTFDQPLFEFTPFDLTATSRQIIAPFFADVDTSEAGQPVTYGTGTFAGRPAFGVNYIDVEYFVSSPEHNNRNSFQVILVDRSDVQVGAFDIVFNYDQIQWETGEASGSDANGRGGASARVGYSNGSGDAGTFFELVGSAVNGAFLDGGPNALVGNRLNSGVNGRYIFQARDGTVIAPNLFNEADGQWVNADPDFQGAGEGLTFDFFPSLELLFVAWFTYPLEAITPAQPGGVVDVGEPGQRWLTAQLDVVDNIAVGPVFSTAGGAFDAPRTDVQRSVQVGEMTIELNSCDSGNVTYNLFNGEITRTFEIIPFEKRVNPNVVCN